jgi:putative oxidoreductase
MFFMAGGSKLSGSEQMVQLFQAIGLGLWGRYFTGFLEVGGAVLLLIPGLSGLGAALLTGVMAGAVATHVFLIGGNPTLPIVLLVLNACVAWSRRSVFAQFTVS